MEVLGSGCSHVGPGRYGEGTSPRLGRPPDFLNFGRRDHRGHRGMSFTAKGDPYRDRKKYHMADKVNGRGGVSALCFKVPRAVSLTVARWTTSEDAVTCPKCLKLLEARKQ